MSDFSRLELAVDSSNAIQNLNKVETHLTKTDDAATKLKNTLKNIGLSIGLTALFKQSIQLSNSFDALNKRVSSFFGSAANKSIEDLTKNFNLADKAAKELLTTAGKFGSATGLGNQQLLDFSDTISKLAADVAAFHAIDDVNSVIERLGAATLGRTQGLREFGVQIDTTTDSFKQQVAAIQEVTGASEAQAKQLYILQEAQRQLEYTQGAAGSQVNSAWQQLNNLFDNFKNILAKVGDIFSTIFAPILKGLNDILRVPFVQTVTAWGIALTALIVPLNSIASSINKSSLALKDVSTSVQEFGVTFTGITQANIHEVNRFENALKRLNAQTKKLQSLRLDRDIYKNIPGNEQKVENIKDQIKEISPISNQLLIQLDSMAATFLKTDISTLKLTASSKRAFDEINQLFTNIKINTGSTSTGLLNLQALLQRLGYSSDETSGKFMNLTDTVDDTSNSVGGLVGIFNNIKTAFDSIASINIGVGIGGVLKSIWALLKSFGAALLSVSKILIPLIIIFASFRDIIVEVQNSLSNGMKELSDQEREYRQRIFDQQDQSIFYRYEEEQLWIFKIGNYINQLFLNIINWINKVINSALGKDLLPTNLKTDTNAYKEWVESQLTNDTLKKLNEQYNEFNNQNFIELKKAQSKEKTEKKKFLQEELKLYQDRYKKLNQQVEENNKKIRDYNEKGVSSILDYSKFLDQSRKTLQDRLNTQLKLNQLEEELSKEEKKQVVDRDVVKNIMSPIQTAVEAVNAQSIEAIKLQSREFVNDTQKDTLAVMKESKEQNKMFFATATQSMKEIKDGLTNLVSTGGDSIQVVNA